MADTPTKTAEELLAEQQQINADLSEKIDSLTKLVGSLNTAAPEKEKPLEIPKETVQSGKKEYKWNLASFKMPGNDVVITAEQAATDKDLIAKILKIEGQGVLSEVV